MAQREQARQVDDVLGSSLRPLPRRLARNKNALTLSSLNFFSSGSVIACTSTAEAGADGREALVLQRSATLGGQCLTPPG